MGTHHCAGGAACAGEQGGVYLSRFSSVTAVKNGGVRRQRVDDRYKRLVVPSSRTLTGCEKCYQVAWRQPTHCVERKAVMRASELLSRQIAVQTVGVLTKGARVDSRATATINPSQRCEHADIGRTYSHIT